jgi:hypothetical protein
VYNDHMGVASLLLNWRADVQAKRQLDITPLHLAAMRGAEEMFRLLLDSGADAKAADKACRPSVLRVEPPFTAAATAAAAASHLNPVQEATERIPLFPPLTTQLST